ncbi:MAG: hypothetical protein KAW12_24675 [Candidatus Aminicenantes bacterium]|nr:hypothetical protein [Candidatus Aminicenantes bacterium]
MEDQKIIENEKFDSLDTGEHKEIICNNSELDNITLTDNANINVKECIFVNSTIRKMTVSGIESAKRIIFINCKVRELLIEDSYLPHLQFIGCDIFDSKFENSNLPGLIFSGDTGKPPGDALTKIQKLLKKNSKKVFSKDLINESVINRTEFLFCDLNDMLVDQTNFVDSKFKHCHIEQLKIMNDVVFQNIDFSGSKFIESSLGNCVFRKIKFRKGFFLVSWLDAVLRKLLSTACLFVNFVLCKGHWNRSIKTEGSLMHFRRFLKRFLYKCNKFHVLVDLISITNFREIRYKEADFSEEYHFWLHIQDLDFIHTFKERHPIFASITFWTSNHMRSFGALFFSSLFVVFVFSLLYSTGWTEFIYWANVGERGAAETYFYLSCKIFTNFGIDPFDAANWKTEFLVIAEIMIGYFALGTLLSIILFPFSRRSSMPQSNTKKGNEEQRD